MSNFNLNKGRILGGLVALFIVLVIHAGASYMNNRPPSGMAGLFIFGVIVGARTGNSIWFQHFGKPTSNIEELKGQNQEKKKTGNPYLDVYLDD